MAEEKHGLVIALIVAIVGIFTVSLVVGAGSDKILICHKVSTDNSQNILVSVNSLGAHLAHGDSIGGCGGICINDGSCGNIVCPIGYKSICSFGIAECVESCDDGRTCVEGASCNLKADCGSTGICLFTTPNKGECSCGSIDPFRI